MNYERPKPRFELKPEANKIDSPHPYVNKDGSSITGYGITASLEEEDIWSQFERHTNEMIVTKIGRKMFPVVKVKLAGLEPVTLYSIILEFKQTDLTKWKFTNGSWISGNIWGYLLQSNCQFFFNFG